MPLIIEDSMLSQLHLTEKEFLLEISLFLYQQKKLSLRKASTLATRNRIEYQEILLSRGIPIHYSVESLEEDLDTIKKLQENRA